MPFTHGAGARLYWRSDGRRDLPAILLLHAIGTDLASWDRAVPHLTPHFHVLRMDIRGHGASDAPGGDYTLELLAADAAAVLDAAGSRSARVCGVSLGGMIAMALALATPTRVRALVLACTSAKMDANVWRERIETVRSGGVAAISDAALSRFFSPAFAKTRPDIVETVRESLLATSVDGYAGCAAAIRDMDFRSRLSAIVLPTLVISGAQDASTPFAAHGGGIARAISGAETLSLDAGHLAQLEQPGAFSSAIIQHEVAAPDNLMAAAKVLYQSGLDTRRRVLGDTWVDQSLANRSEFTVEFQAMITRIAWNEVWNRPELEERVRRLLVVAMTASLGRWEEFRLHVRSGLEQGGFTSSDLKEVLMQTAIYAGVPAANTAFAEADQILKNLDPPSISS